MTANQRRPGFRLPWASETDAGSEGDASTSADAATADAATADAATADAATADAATADAAIAAGGPSAAPGTSDAANGTDPAAAGETTEATVTAAATDGGDEASAGAEHQAEGGSMDVAEPAAEMEQPAAAGAGASGAEFMRDLVAAMRRVADEARDAGLTELRTRADEQVRKLEEDAEHRREDLRARAEADIAGVGEWAKAEAERIKAEAEQRVVTRRTQLEQQLAADQSRTEAETKALRDRVAQYERELEAYHAQLAEIGDPAAFAAAAKRMPAPPSLGGGHAPASQPTEPAAATAGSGSTTDAPVEPGAGGSNGVAADAAPAVHPAEEEVLAGRLAELDAALPEKEAAASAVTTEPVTTEVVVKGLGSFGAITGFRQSLSGVEGIDGVALSLGQTGEFVFRATHGAGFDLRNAIAGLEGENAKVEDRPEGGLKVTLERAR